MRVTIVGYGGVGGSLVEALRGKVELKVAVRNKVAMKKLIDCSWCDFYDLEQLPESDVYILATSDSAVGMLAERLNFSEGSLVLHTAGSVDVSLLRCENTTARECAVGVLYPMQSFSRGRVVGFEGVPLFLESERREQLLTLANILSDNVMWMSSQQRVELHMAAVFCSNFVNAMFVAADDILRQSSLSIELYRPLIELTVRKVLDGGMSPREAQTGPARRGDEVTMERHREALSNMSGNNTQLTDLYNIISKYIWETSRKI